MIVKSVKNEIKVRFKTDEKRKHKTVQFQKTRRIVVSNHPVLRYT